MATELEKMRVEQEKLMKETVYVQRLTKMQDDTGGWNEAWITVLTIKGRTGNKQTRTVESMVGGQVTLKSEFVITLPADTMLQEDDRLQINGKQYAITRILSHTEQTALQVECVEV